MNISVAEPPKQCCLYANETIVKDVVRYIFTCHPEVKFCSIKIFEQANNSPILDKCDLFHTYNELWDFFAR